MKTTTTTAKADDTTAKLAALLKENAAAAKALEGYFGAERWLKIKAQCEARMMVAAQIEAACGKAVRCNKEWLVGESDRCQLIGSANYFLTLIGSEPGDADVKALREAFKTAGKGTAETATN